jgi:hypothetical protein
VPINISKIRLWKAEWHIVEDSNHAWDSRTPRFDERKSAILTYVSRSSSEFVKGSADMKRQIGHNIFFTHWSLLIIISSWHLLLHVYPTRGMRKTRDKISCRSHTQPTHVKSCTNFWRWNLNSKAIAVTDPGGVLGCKTSRIPHFLDNRLIDGGEVVIMTRRPRFIHRKIFWYSFLLEDE